MGATGIASSWKMEQCQGWKWELNVRINCADTQREHVVAGSPKTRALKITTCFLEAFIMSEGHAQLDPVAAL